MTPPVAIIGAGPAGMSAAIAVAGERQTEIFEYLSAPGRKLLASGAGKCNITNVLPPEEMAARFERNQQRFVRPALLEFPPEQLLEFFRERGVKFKAEDGFHYFPASERASDILEVLRGELNRLDAKLHHSAPVTELVSEHGRITGVISGNRLHPCSAVVVCAGGPGFPALGGRGSIYPLLEKLGHHVVPPVPALAGIRCDAPFCADVSGTVLPDAELKLDAQNRSRGELLFTHHGISGPAVLDLCGRISRKLLDAQSIPLTMNFEADIPPAEWRNRFDRFRAESGKRPARAFPARYLTRTLAGIVSELAGLDDIRVSELSAEKREKLLELLSAFPFTVTAADPWEKAMCSAGGVSRNEIRANSLQSKLYENLFFAGEVIDVDGPCGGYNLQWAFSSGRLAGKCVLRLVRVI